MRRRQFIRGNSAFNNAFIGNAGELTVDSQTGELRLHDGSTPGGKIIPNTTTVPGLTRNQFVAQKNLTAGNIAATDADKLLYGTNGGVYVLPPNAQCFVGMHIWFSARVAGINLAAAAGDQLVDRLTAGYRALNNGETVHVGFVGGATWQVLSAY